MLDSSNAFSRRDAVKLTGLLLLALLACGLVFGFAIGVVIGFTKAMHVPAPAWASATHPGFTLICNTSAFALAIGYALRRSTINRRELLGSVPAKPLVYAAAIVALAGVKIVNSEVGNWLERVAPPPQFLKGVFGAMIDLAQHPLSGPLVLVVVAPLTEELFFRGLILRRLLTTRSSQQAIWTSALLFMAFHLNPWQFPIALLMGLLLGWLFARTRSLGLCMFAHAFVNATAMLSTGLPFHVRGFNAPHADGMVAFQPWWFDLAGVAALAIGLYLLSRVMPPMRVNPLPPEPPPLPAAVAAVPAEPGS